MLRDLLEEKCDLTDVELTAAADEALTPAPSEEERKEQLDRWDPVELLVPEWNYLQKPALFAQQENASGLMVTEMPKSPHLPDIVHRVIAVNRMKKVNAVIGFTRIDELERVSDVSTRLVKLTRDRQPSWVPATEDRCEGVFIQLDEAAVEEWEQKIIASPLWELTGRRTGVTSNAACPAPPRTSTRTPVSRPRGTGWCTPYLPGSKRTRHRRAPAHHPLLVGSSLCPTGAT